VHWEKRLSEKAEAQAALTALEGKRRQAEADVAQAAKRLEDTNKDLVSVEKQRAQLISGIEKLKAEHLSLTKAITAAKVGLDQAIESERRLNEAQNALTSLNTRRKQIEGDIADVQKRLDQLHGEADDARKGREKLAAEAAMLRQQVQILKDEKTDLEQRISGLKAIQATVQQEERKLQQIRKEVTEGELRRDTARAGLQKIDSDLSAARKLLQEASAKRDALVRESSGLESTIGGLKSEGGQLEKRLEQIRKEVRDRKPKCLMPATRHAVWAEFRWLRPGQPCCLHLAQMMAWPDAMTRNSHGARKDASSPRAQARYWQKASGHSSWQLAFRSIPSRQPLWFLTHLTKRASKSFSTISSRSASH
jgi:chromosome segregation ATPase